MSDPMPAFIAIGPFRYLVRTDLAAQVELLDAEAVGQTNADRTEILMSLDQSPQRMRVTLLHEVIHACADLADLTDDSTEEEWASRLAPVLLRVLWENPALLAYIMGRGE